MQAENIISMVIEEELEAPNKNAYHPNPLTYMKISYSSNGFMDAL